MYFFKRLYFFIRERERKRVGAGVGAEGEGEKESQADSRRARDHYSAPSHYPKTTSWIKEPKSRVGCLTD